MRCFYVSGKIADLDLGSDESKVSEVEEVQNDK